MKGLIYSTGLYSTWFFSQDFNTLFDCGEGAATALGNKIFAVDRICLTHDHMDHIGGIPSFLCARMGARGDHGKPLLILHPDTPEIRNLRSYIKTFSSSLPYPLEWRCFKPGDRLELPGGKHFLIPFAARHTDGALGYQIFQERAKLKAEYRNQPDIGRLLAGMAEEEKLAYYESSPLSLLAFSGDTMPIDPTLIEETKCLFFDSTFLHAADRRDILGDTHATIDEAFEIAKAAHVTQFFAYHISPRYSAAEIAEAEARLANRQPNFEFRIIRPGEVSDIR